MAIAWVQGVKAVISGSSGTTAAITIAAGSVIARGMEWDNTINFTSITDSRSQTHTIMDAERTVSSIKARAYRIENAAAGSTTFSGAVSSSANISLYVDEITGAPTSGSFDLAAGGTDSASPFGNAISITTTQAAELLWAFLAGNSGTTPATHAESTGFTVRQDVTTGGPDWTGCTATRVVASTGAYNASFTENGGTAGCVFIAGFKEDGSGGGGSTLAARKSLLGVGV